MEFELKTLSPDAVPRALEKAVRYRLLNEPGEAASICLDVLAADAGNQEANATLILALTDQFEGEEGTASGSGARGRVSAAACPMPASGRTNGCAKRWSATSGPRPCVRRGTTTRC
jgi:hypothetical protein